MPRFVPKVFYGVAVGDFPCCSILVMPLVGERQCITMTSGVSNHQPHHCLHNRLFRLRSNKKIKAPRHWLLYGEFTSKFPAQMASNAENVFIWWRHHGNPGTMRHSVLLLTVAILEMLSWRGISVLCRMSLYRTNYICATNGGMGICTIGKYPQDVDGTTTSLNPFSFSLPGSTLQAVYGI